MSDTWKSIFNETIEGRPVEIEISDEGGYRVHTTQGADDPDTVQSDDSSTLIMPPMEKGSKITFEEETPSEIRNTLIYEGFSEMGANEIVGKLSA